MDEYTADAWHDVLAQYGLGECRAASASLAAEQRYIAPCDIVARVARDRRTAAGRQRRAMLDAQLPPALTARPGTDTRLTREEIDRIFADVTRHIGRPPARKPPAAASAADTEAERRRQLAALDQMIRQEAGSE